MEDTKSSKKSSLIIPSLLFIGGAVFMVGNVFHKVNDKNKAEGRRPLIETTVTKTGNDVHVENIVGTPTQNEATSQVALSEFWVKARINFPVPHVLKYKKVEATAKETMVLHGTDGATETELILIARNDLMNTEKLKSFLEQTGLGKAVEKEIPDGEKDIPLPATTNLQSAKVWRFIGKTQDRIISLTNRLDKTGSFTVIYKVPKGKLDSSEEFLIALLKEAIAQ